MSKFGNLHVHTHYSTLDGLGKPEELVKRAKELGQSFIAITDHSSTSGLYDMQKAGDKHGIKTILGNEFYFHHDSVKKLGHLIVLAKNNIGLRNIYKMQEEAFVNNFYYKARINFDILKRHSQGIIVTSACIGNTIPQLILEGKYKEAKIIALEFKKILGNDFYLEIQANSIPEQFILNKELIRLHKDTGIPLVATNDVHYTYKTDGELKKYKDEFDYSVHDVLLALQVNKKVNDPERFRFGTQDYWLKSEEEMLEGLSNLPQDYVRQALDNTKTIADKCNARIEKGNFLPHFHTIPEGKTEAQLLRELITKKYNKNIITNGEHNKEFANDVAKELDVIESMGYPGYFLIVQDYINWARENEIIVGDGRG